MSDPDPKIQEAIAFFEQMLQTMPGDRTSLEFLVVAYEQTGQTDRRRECLVRLVDALLSEKDYDNAQVIAERLSTFRDYPPAQAAVKRVIEAVQDQILQGQFQSDMQKAVVPAERSVSSSEAALPDKGIEVHALSHSASAAEMDLVWLWIERGFLAKEVGMDVLHVLTDRPVTETPMLISALALLDEQHPELTDGVMEAMQRASDVPVLPLELFEVAPAASGLLPSGFIRIKGVLPFAVMGGEALVAVMNPLNSALQAEVAMRVGKPCHFFLVNPRTWQAAADKVI